MLGLNEVIEHCRSWAEESELARIFMSPTVQNLEVGGLMTADRIRALCDEVLAGMDLDDTAAPVFRSMLEKLEKAYVDNNGRSVFGWVVMVEAEFFQRVDSGEAAAMVILACWGALTFALEEIWWTKYVGRRIVEDISSRLYDCDGPWKEVLQWCYEEVGIANNV